MAPIHYGFGGDTREYGGRHEDWQQTYVARNLGRGCVTAWIVAPMSGAIRGPLQIDLPRSQYVKPFPKDSEQRLTI